MAIRQKPHCERDNFLSVSLNVIEWHLLSHATIRFSHFLVHGISPFFNIWSSSKNSFNPMLCLKAFPIDYSRLFHAIFWFLVNFQFCNFSHHLAYIFHLKPYELLKGKKLKSTVVENYKKKSHFLTSSLRSSSVIRQVNFKCTKIDEKCQNKKKK